MPDPIEALAGVQPGRALDLAAGSGRHSLRLAELGWEVTAVDIEIGDIPGVRCVRADLEKHEYRIAPDSWDLIVCWRYWQPNLLPEIRAEFAKAAALRWPARQPGALRPLSIDIEKLSRNGRRSHQASTSR